ncbi:MAG TPA: acyl carrier protein [Candidatus Nanopelagicales bacterium]|nr:acyl carrier protein [Candidatus Nanopelagicales bacterium]
MPIAEEKLKQVFADAFGVDPDSIDEETSIDSLAEWTSMQHLTLVVALEEAFSVRLTEQETIEILSYALVKAVLAEHGVHFSPGAGR